MATVEVSTYPEFIAALQTSGSSSLTVKLIADIDCNDAIPQGVSSTINIYSGSNSNVTITGAYTENGVTKNHVIRNLRTHTSSPVAIFNITSNNSSGGGALSFTLRNIDFVNLYIKGATFMKTTKLWWKDNYVSVVNCRFVGKRDSVLFTGETYTYLTLTSCFFNMPNIGTAVTLDSSWENVYADYCRFKETYTGWDLSTTAQTSAYNMKLNGCYIGGEIVASAQITVTSMYSYGSSLQNVVDADLYVTSGGAAGSDINVTAPKGVYKNLIRDYTDKTIVYQDVKQNTNSISASPEHMEDASWLSSQGFDIVVPSGA